jgi:hypothetical protein
VADEFKEELSDQIVAPLSEAIAIVIALEQHLERLSQLGDDVGMEAVDAVLGRITRWIWPLLRDLDEEDGRYDD